MISWKRVGGAFVVGITAASAGLVASLGWLIATRVLMGLGEACFFVGGTTMATSFSTRRRLAGSVVRVMAPPGSEGSESESLLKSLTDEYCHLVTLPV